MTDRRRTNPEEVGLPGFLKRTQKSGKAYYYFDNGKKPRKEIPLGPDRDRALAKYNLLIGAVDGYQLKPRTFYLYRHFDDEGLLLYVGVSLSALSRLEAHRQEAAWFWNIARVEIEKFASREESLTAERIAVQNEHPLFNLRMAHPTRAKGAHILRGKTEKVGALLTPIQK